MDDTVEGKGETQEREKQTELNLFFLPNCEEHEGGFLREAIPHFSFSRFERNLGILQEIDPDDIESPYWRRLFLANRQQLQEKYNTQKTTLKKLDHECTPILDTLAREFPSLTISHQREISISELESIAKEQLIASTQNIIFLSNSHLSTYAELKTAQAVGHKDDKVGLIVFDQHTDFYTYLRTNDINRDSQRPQKRDFLKFLLDDNCIHGFSIIGSPPEQMESITEKINDTEGTNVYYRQHTNSISIADERQFRNEKGKIDRQAFIEEVKKQIDFLRQAGVTRIVVSVDFDVLRSDAMWYTSMEYNSLSTVFNLGIQDLSQSVDLGLLTEILDSKGLSATKENIRKVTAQMRAGSIRGTLLPIKETEYIFGIDRPKVASASSGLPLGLVGDALEVVGDYKKRGLINVGINLPNGGLFIGDITELSAPDFQGRSSKAVIALSKKMCNLFGKKVG